jgi:uncharacterized repeat protein (TIGR01451 family)
VFQRWLRVLVGTVALSILLAGAGSPARGSTTTFVVDSTADTATCDANACTLRGAITAADASGGPSEIEFAIPGTGVQTIQPATPLPAITEPVVLDGYTQPGASPNTRLLGDDATILIRLDAAACSCAFDRGLDVQPAAAGTVIRGLSITGSWNAGIWFEGGSGDVAVGDFVGLAPDGSAGPGMAGNGIVADDSAGAIIGGPGPADRDVVSGNGTGFSGTAGIALGGTAAGDLVENDYVGTTPSGTTAAGNPGTGINALVPGALIVDNLVSGNGGDGVDLGSYGGTTVRGNFVGVDATGSAALGNGGYGVFAGAPGDVTIGGPDAADRNVIAANDAGVYTASGFVAAAEVVVQGNYIGTDVAGESALGNHLFGIGVNGGADLGDQFLDNVISGSGSTFDNGNGCTCSYGIDSTGSGITIRGNLIGVGADGTTALPNAGGGITLGGGSDIQVGGPGSGDGNTIADNGVPFPWSRAQGVVVRGTGVSILGNSIHDNTGLGIDLNDNSVVDPNDPGDPDGGGNLTQNFPVLSDVVSGTSPVVTGTLDSTASTQFRVEFFASPVCDSSGNGEGETFLGSATVSTGADGTASFTATLPTAVGAGDAVTATATDPNGNTSEFSACTSSRRASADLHLAVADSPDPVGVGGDLTYTFTATNNGPDPAADVSLTDALPVGATLVSAAASQGSCSGTTSVGCALGTIGSGTAAVVTIHVSPTAAGTLTNTGSVTSSAADPVPGDESATAATTVTAPAADLVVTGTQAIDATTYVQETITLRNAGPDAAPQTAVTVSAPGIASGGWTVTATGAHPCSATGAQGAPAVCALGTVAAGETVALTVDVGKAAPVGTVVTVAASASVADPDPTNNSVNVFAPAPIGSTFPTIPPNLPPPPAPILHVSSTLTDEPGLAAELQLVITNTGTADSGLTDFTVDLEGAELLSASLGQPECEWAFTNDYSGERMTCVLPSIAPGAAAEVDVGVAPMNVIDGVHWTSDAVAVPRVRGTSGESKVTKTLACTITGTDGNDHIVGTPGDDVICALGGDDHVDGGGGNDVIIGGYGNDTLAGGPGNDTLIGDSGLLDSGSDTLDGGPGNDVLYGDSVLGGDNPSDDHNTLTGDAGNDMLVGGDAVNTMHGGDGSDVLLASGDPRASVQSVLYGDAGSDSLNGLGDPKGKLFGGAGDDTLISSPQGLAIDGGDGADTVDYSKSSCTAGVDVELEAGTAACRGRQGGLDKLAHVENITGSPGDDILIGDDGPNVIDGGAGNDTLEGLAGNDILFGRDGNDGVSGGAGNDILVPGAGEDTVTGGPGADWAGTVDGFVDTIVCADSSDTFRTESIDRFVCKTKKPLP